MALFEYGSFVPRGLEECPSDFRKIFGKELETTNGNKNGPSTNGHRYLFDGFEIDPTDRRCLFKGVEVALTGRVFDILLTFVQNPGRLLEKDELIEKVWQGDFVEEGNLTRNISSLRKALRDTGKEHKYIATVQGHGYRFIADVISAEIPAEGRRETLIRKADQVGLNNGSDRGHVDIGSEAKFENLAAERFLSQLYRRPWLLSIAAFCLIGTVLVAFRLEVPKPRRIDLLSFDRLRQTRLTQEGNSFGGGLISPDGQYLAFSRVSGNEKALCLRQMATGSVLELQPPETGIGYWALAFAPDNSFLYYILKEKDADYGNLYRIPLLGGPPYKLTTHANGGLTVSPDGRRLAFQRIDRQAGTSSIVAVEADGANEQIVSSSNLDSLFSSLDWSPDGNSFVYSFKRHEDGRDYWYLAEIPVAGGAEQRIGEPSDSAILAAKWLPDKSGLVVNAIDETTRQPQIYAVSYPDGARRRLTNNQSSFPGFSITADGRVMVLPQINSSRQIWNLPGGNMQNAIQALTGTEKHFDSISWAQNGDLVFDEDENSSFDKFNIYRMRPDGTDVQQLTFGEGDNTEPTVSPDGTIIVFVSGRSGKRQIWRMNNDGRELAQLTDIAYTVIRPSFLPDGQTIFFSVSIAGKCNIWKVSVDGHEPSIVTDADVYRWAVSPDGMRLAYSSFDTQVKAVRTRIHLLQENAPDIILNISPETWMEWSNDGKAIYFDTAQDGTQNIWRQPLDGSKPRPVTAFNTQQIFRFAWSPDGNNLACIRHTTTYDAVILRFD